MLTEEIPMKKSKFKDSQKIDVSFRELTNRIHPKSHIGELRGLLPQKYSPLRANGDSDLPAFFGPLLPREGLRPASWLITTSA